MPWKNQGGGPWGSGPKGPWGSGPQTVGPRPPDLEDLLRRGQDRLQQLLPGGYFSGAGISVLLIVVAIWLASGFFRVQSEELGQPGRSRCARARGADHPGRRRLQAAGDCRSKRPERAFPQGL